MSCMSDVSRVNFSCTRSVIHQIITQKTMHRYSGVYSMDGTCSFVLAWLTLCLNRIIWQYRIHCLAISSTLTNFFSFLHRFWNYQSCNFTIFISSNLKTVYCYCITQWIIYFLKLTKFCIIIRFNLIKDICLNRKTN